MRYIDIEKIKKELFNDNPLGWNDSDLAKKVDEYSNKAPMTNFEKFKQDLTIERLTSMLVDTYCERVCDYCAYNSHSCIEDCEYGIKKYLASEVTNNDN